MRPSFTSLPTSAKKTHRRCYPGALAFTIILSLSAAVPSASAQTFTVLHSFLGPEGQFPNTGLVRDAAGNLYGTAQYGGLYQNCDEELGGGTVFKLSPSGKVTTLHAFNNGSDGCFPSAGVILDSAGNLYGTTTYDNVFKIDAAGELSVLYHFTTEAEGAVPLGPLFRDAQGSLYGTTSGGGDPACVCGTVFKLDAAGKETVLYSFKGPPDGANPQSGVIRDAAGNLYGTTPSGGDPSCVDGCGTVFKIDTSGKETVLYTFTGGTDGYLPGAGLIRDNAGNLYGATEYGGNLNCDNEAGCGVVFKLDAAGTETVLYTFTGGADGQNPVAGLTRDSAGNLYGTTALGGDSNNDGTIFELNKTGKKTTLYKFNGRQGSNPLGIIRDSAGNLYGTTGAGGSGGAGTVFKLAP
jgi:uncharacterized repeat protein (TIGR03803 family)